MNDLVDASGWLYKVREWCVRYLPAEAAGTVCAVVGAFLAWKFTEDRAVAALIGTVSECIGFYGVIVVAELRRRRSDRPTRVTSSAWRVFAATVAEFGGAELLDSLLVRPLAMYAGPLVVGNVAGGVLLGKVLADLVFYGCAIISYEFIRHHARPGCVF